jgi:hypothetical protein
MDYRVHTEDVRQFHESAARVRIVCAPARTSKSWATGHDSVVEGLPTFEQDKGRWKPQQTRLSWIIGPDYPTNKEFQYVWDQVVEGPIKDFGTIESASNSPNQGNMRIVMRFANSKHGKYVRSIWEGKSSTNERSLQGEQPDFVCLSEAAEHPEKIWSRYVGTRYGRAVLPTTPKNHALWIKDMIELGKIDNQLSMESFEFTPEANPTYDWERFWLEHQKAESRTTGGRIEYRPADLFGTFNQNEHHCLHDHCNAFKDAFFAEQFLGQWTLYEARVLPFRVIEGPNGEPPHVLTQDPVELEDAKWFWSFDYGYRDEFVGLLWCMLPGGELVILDEIYESEMTEQVIMERVRAVERRYHDPRMEFYVGDPKRPNVEGLLNSVGLPVYGGSKNTLCDRELGKKLLISKLSTDPETNRPGLYVHARCRKLIREWQELRYKEGARDENAPTALAGNDHGYDAARYGIVASQWMKPKPLRNWRVDFEKHLKWRNRRRIPPNHPLVGSGPVISQNGGW